MKKRIVSLLLAAAMLVLLAVPAFAEDGHAYTYVALGDSITTGVGLKDTLKLLDSGMEEICDQTRGQTVANVEQILQEMRALNPDAQIILVGYYNPLPFLPTYGRHFRLLNRSVKALAQQYGADYVSIPYTSIANDGHPTVCGHKYIARQILKAVRK